MARWARVSPFSRVEFRLSGAAKGVSVTVELARLRAWSGKVLRRHRAE